MVPRHEPPNLDRPSFTCPHCKAYAHQERLELMWSPLGEDQFEEHRSLQTTRCAACDREVLWYTPDIAMDYVAVYPMVSSAPLAHQKMPKDVRSLYAEAGDVSVRSPRAAAALLRLALQVLLLELVPGEKKIDNAIAVLVERGLDIRVQQAMDVVRVVGNNAVHPGEVQVDEDPDLVPTMFELVNIIVERMIDQPERIDELFQKLPQGPREAIARRDKAARQRAAAGAAAESAE